MVEIRLVKHREKIDELVDLFSAAFGRNMSAELWDWKYIQNPLATPDPEVIVALDNGRIVGARPFRLAEMWLGNEKVKAPLGGNAMVHPEHQRKGIYSQMLQFGLNYLRENGYALSCGFTNEKSLPGNLKQGFRIVAPTETMFRAINPQKLISYGLGNKVLGGGLGFLYDKFLNTKPRETFQPSAFFQIEIFDQFNEGLKEIDTLRDTSLIELVRSESYLRWRFARCPNRKYRYVVAKRDETLWGYAVVSVQAQSSGLVCGYIVDHLVRYRDIACFHTLIDRSLDELKKSGCDVVFIRALGELVLREQLLKHLGFKSPLMFPYSRFSHHEYFVALMLDEQAAAGIDVYDKNNYRVTYAYSGEI